MFNNLIKELPTKNEEFLISHSALRVNNIEDLDYRGLTFLDRIPGCMINKNVISGELIVDLILSFLKLNKYYLFGCDVYVGIGKTKMSYRYIGSVEYLFYDNLYTTVVIYFLKNFPCQFSGFDFDLLLRIYKTPMKYKILDTVYTTINSLDTKPNHIEG